MTVSLSHSDRRLGAANLVGRSDFPISTWDIPLAAMAMALVSFSLPDRDAPDTAESLDWIGIFKVAIRLLIVFWFGLLLIRNLLGRNQVGPGRTQRGSGSTQSAMTDLKWLSPLLAPWYLYLVWSFFTVGWSPLPTFSAGQWLGLLGLVLFAQSVSTRYDYGRLTGVPVTSESMSIRRWTPSKNLNWRILVIQLCSILTLYSLMVFVVHLIAPGFSGLDRSLGYEGMVHPTAVGAASSLGLVLSLVIFIRRWSRHRGWILGCMMIHAPVLVLANARAALIMAAVAIVLCVALLMSPRARGFVMMTLASMILLVILLDPGLNMVNEFSRGSGDYLSRGQTTHQLREVSGRAELWETLLVEFWKSPMLGHGYLVTSQAGQVFVWGQFANQDAHNVFFQPFVSTGIIGGVILVLAAWRLVSSVYRLFYFNPAGTDLRELALLWVILGTWYLGWGMGCTSFLGPVRPESVVFFGMLGLLVGGISHSPPVPPQTDTLS